MYIWAHLSKALIIFLCLLHLLLMEEEVRNSKSLLLSRLFFQKELLLYCSVAQSCVSNSFIIVLFSFQLRLNNPLDSRRSFLSQSVGWIGYLFSTCTPIYVHKCHECNHVMFPLVNSVFENLSKTRRSSVCFPMKDGDRKGLSGSLQSVGETGNLLRLGIWSASYFKATRCCVLLPPVFVFASSRLKHSMFSGIKDLYLGSVRLKNTVVPRKP